MHQNKLACDSNFHKLFEAFMNEPVYSLSLSGKHAFLEEKNELFIMSVTREIDIRMTVFKII